VYTSNKRNTVPCACTTVKKLSRVLGRTYDAALSGTGINITQLAVLRCISRHDGEPLVRVAEEMELDRTSLYRAIDPMVRDGWLALAPGADARSRTAKVTKKGAQLLARAGGNWEDVQGQIIEQFGRPAYTALIAELHRLADCAETASLSQ
jgi:DNA-binding MarR family transcriptional regulator